MRSMFKLESRVDAGGAALAAQAGTLEGVRSRRSGPSLPVLGAVVGAWSAPWLRRISCGIRAIVTAGSTTAAIVAVRGAKRSSTVRCVATRAAFAAPAFLNLNRIGCLKSSRKRRLSFDESEQRDLQ